MAKTSFAKKASSTPAPARPAAGQKPPQKPTPAKNPAPARAPTPAARTVPGKPTPASRPSPARPTPAAAATRPTPARQTPVPAARGPQPAQRPAPAAQQRTPQRPSPARIQPQPEATVDVEAEVLNQGVHGNAPEGDYVPESPEELAAEAAADNAALAPQNQQNLMGAQVGSIVGDLNTGDYSFPSLKLAQALGPLTEDLGFISGQIVFNEQTVLWEEGCAEIEVTFLKAMKQFVEQTEMGEMSRIFNSLEEARAEGLETEWGPNGEKPQVLPQLLAMIMVKCPEGVDPVDFPIEHESGLYALGMWRISGASYKPLVQRITGAARTRLKGGLHTGTFLVSAKKITGQFTYWVPLLNPGAMHEPEFVEFIESQLQ